MPLPPSRVFARVVSSEGEAIGGAVVALLGPRPADPVEYVTTDAKGVAAFLDVAPGGLQLSGHATGFVPATLSIPETGRASIVITLTREKPNRP
jgi:hypothetical protein